MTTTNRALNRLLLAFSGLLLLLAGSSATLVASVPAALQLWRSGAAFAIVETETLLSAIPVAATGDSWAGVAVVALMAALIGALVAFTVRQGRGRTRTLVNTPQTDQGRTRIDAAFAEQALEQSLAGQSDFLGLHTSTYRVNGASMLKVSVVARRGTAPRDVIDAVHQSVRGLDRVLGTEIPVLLHIGGGFRSRLAGPTHIRRTTA
ncbi:hypothetical protein E3T55_14780 [Cryobacterium frigoriphilum]|uniref:Uncharacterized protein n=1 Tax=Cryobacterium frigoriphilum TaxID=1259150 RepID=A0A4V3IQN8_9MICO|nr:hypothetical protein [Cryobacterium frigoriphilum]TFD47816.1 hypothetical protein E3T55_14780 [Cryobacterium frigoriphilum]